MTEKDWGSALSEIVEQMARTGVYELEIRQDDLRIRLKRRTGDPVPGLNEPYAETDRGAAEKREDGHRQIHKVTAPLTGVFYTAPNPSADPYVGTGEWIEPGTVVGLIETMKVFNEVMAECVGRVAEMVAQQGQLVQAGDTIVLVDTAALPDEAGEAGS